jgi:hypothetical protein
MSSSGEVPLCEDAAVGIRRGLRSCDGLGLDQGSHFRVLEPTVFDRFEHGPANLTMLESRVKNVEKTNQSQLIFATQGPSN